MDSEKLKKIRDKINRQIGDEGVKIVVADPELASNLTDSFNFGTKLTETNTALGELARLLRMSNIENKELTKQEAEAQNKILCDIGALLTEINNNTSKEIIPPPDHTDELVSAINKNKPLDSVKVIGLEGALEKVAPKESDLPISATMELDQDLWRSVTIKYPKTTLKVGIERTGNKVIKRLTFQKI